MNSLWVQVDQEQGICQANKAEECRLRGSHIQHCTTSLLQYMNGLWVQVDQEQGICQATVTLPLNAPKVPVARVVERIAATTMVRETRGMPHVPQLGV